MEIITEMIENNTTDYSNIDNWLAADIVGTKAVDIFYLYSTTYQKGPKDPNYCKVNDSLMRKRAKGVFNREATAFIPVGNIYAPYYRQADARYILNQATIKKQDKAVRLIPTVDGMAAFQYYLENYNNGKPFILAGHSQGSMILLDILPELINQPEVYKRMVAAYIIGMSVTKEYLERHSHLKFAQGADDTGVIISYNTQAKGVFVNPFIRDGAIAINPISWTLTDAIAAKENNLGSIKAINVVEADLTPIRNLASAQVDTDIGVVVCDTVAINRYSMLGLPRGVYHSFDYLFYYYNIRENALKRVKKYFDKDA